VTKFAFRGGFRAERKVGRRPASPRSAGIAAIPSPSNRQMETTLQLKLPERKKSFFRIGETSGTRRSELDTRIARCDEQDSEADPERTLDVDEVEEAARV
jgi:hypothetical protein